MRKIIFAFFVNILFVTGTIAQNVEFTKENFPNQSRELNSALKNIRSGDKKYFSKDKKNNNILKYKQALDHYTEAQRFNPKNVILNLKIAFCYYHMNNPLSAMQYGVHAYDLDSSLSYKVLFFKGYELHLNNQFDEAVAYYNKFKSSKEITSEEKQIVTQKIKECEAGKILLKTETHCFIDNLGQSINTTLDEYLPVSTYNDSLLYFVSRRENEKGINPEDGRYKEQIYFSNCDKDGDFFAASVFDKKISKDFDAIQAISKDGKTAILYSSKNGGDLYEVEIRNGKWMTPKAIGAINTSYHETSASFTPDGDTLYFCSNRDDTYGEHDIYRSIRNKNGKWSKPQNLGNVINTPADEISVYADGKGNLYFSSRGHQSMGGFDIFKSTFENGVWTKPRNIGYPVNSPFDDVYFSISDDGKQGYFASNRQNGYGRQDIYRVVFLGEVKLFIYNPEDILPSEYSAVLKPFSVQAMDMKKDNSTIVQGMIMDAQTKEPLYAIIELYDITENKLLATFNSDSLTGKYTLSLPSGINYGVSVKKEGYLFYSENFNISDSTDSRIIDQVIMLNTLEVNQKLVLKNIFFDINKTTLRLESRTEIDNVYKLMTQYPNIEIEVSGHTDNSGTDAYNKKLSQGRALAVSNALKEKGIDPARIKSVGYGYDRPIAPNTTETGRAQNRRTEIKIIKK
jgi:outer membrane protein OmpA-like peptidoglycan-associated protein